MPKKKKGLSEDAARKLVEAIGRHSGTKGFQRHQWAETFVLAVRELVQHPKAAWPWGAIFWIRLNGVLDELDSQFRFLHDARLSAGRPPTEGTLGWHAERVFEAIQAIRATLSEDELIFVHYCRTMTAHVAPIIPVELFDRVQALLESRKEKRPTGRESGNYVYLLEGLVRCGACGATMSRMVANGTGGTYFYYKCSRKTRTSNAACKLRDVPAAALEKFVLDQLRGYSLAPGKIREAVAEANAGRDDELERVKEELQKVAAARQQQGKLIQRLLDQLETADDAALPSVRDRLKERESADQQLKVQQFDLEARKQILTQQLLDAAVIIEGYGSLPAILEKAQRRADKGREELQAVLKSVVKVIEWRQDPVDPKKGEALIELYELRPGFLASNSQDVSSLGRQTQLPGQDSNLRHGG